MVVDVFVVVSTVVFFVVVSSNSGVLTNASTVVVSVIFLVDTVFAVVDEIAGDAVFVDVATVVVSAFIDNFGALLEVFGSSVVTMMSADTSIDFGRHNDMYSENFVVNLK